MYWLSVLFVTVLAAPLGLTTSLSPRWDDMRSKHSWGSIPEKWECQCHPPVGTIIDLRIALKPHRESALIDALYEVSDPNHSKYDTLELVGSWLAHHEVPSSAVSTTHGGGWLTIKKVPLAQANTLLGASYQTYRHTETNESVIRTVGYSLPAALHEHVQTVAPTTYFGSPRPFRQPSKLESNTPTPPDATFAPGDPIPFNCSSIITPTCLRLLYKTWAYEPLATSKNKIGITGYLGQYASYSDLTAFLTRFRKDAATANFSVVTVDGGINNQIQPGSEANIDIQYAESISYPTPNIFYSTAGAPPYIPDSNTPTDTNEPYLDCVFFSSGDGGVGGAGFMNGSCLSNDGMNRTEFLPAFPASCPFVTAVGGTTQVNPEVAANFSGGGFSNYFARPSYQNTVLSLHTSKTLVASILASLTLLGVDTQISLLKRLTSKLYSPEKSRAFTTATGVISLLNDFLISKGKSALGFLNPLIYSTGSNPGCGTSGFSAVKGWDPVTGLGTPDFQELQGIVG
ncbi:serine protease [Russula decolorans]